MCGAHRNPVFGELLLRAGPPFETLGALLKVNLRSFAPSFRSATTIPGSAGVFAQHKHSFGDGIPRIIRFAGIFICARVALATAAPTASKPADRSTFSRFQRYSIALRERPCNHGSAEFLHRTRNALIR